MAESDLALFESRWQPVISAYLHAAWRAHLSGRPTPRAPRVSQAELGRLRSLRDGSEVAVVRRRADMLWRAAVLDIIGAAGAGAFELTAATIGERNRLSRAMGFSDYYSLVQTLDDTEDGALDAALAAPKVWQRSAEPEPEFPTMSVAALLRVVGRRTDWPELRSIRVDIAAVAPSRTYFIRNGDVRVVVQRARGWRGWQRALHELGHGLYFARASREQPWALAVAPTRTISELSAELFAGLLHDVTVLQDIGLSRAGARAARLWLSERAQRWRYAQCVRAAFERDAYRSDGHRPLRELWQQAVAQYAGVDQRITDYVDTPHFVTDPGSQASYLLAHHWAGQLCPVAGEHASIANRLELFSRLARAGARFDGRTLLTRQAGVADLPGAQRG